MLRGQATALFLAAIVVMAFSPGTTAQKVAVAAGLKRAAQTPPNTALVAQAMPSYIPWFYQPTQIWPTPIPSANAGIEGAFAAGNVYNTAGGFGFDKRSGLKMLQTGLCNFVCFAGPGDKSHHIVAFGSDASQDATAFSHLDRKSVV